MDKHNREDKEFKKIYSLIQQNLVKSKQVIEKINQAYINLLTLQSFIYKKNEIIPRFNPQEKTDKIEPLSFVNIDLDELKNSLSRINTEAEVFLEQFVKVSDISYIQDTFSISYREFLGSIIHLLYQNEIEIKDFYGSNIVFKVN